MIVTRRQLSIRTRAASDAVVRASSGEIPYFLTIVFDSKKYVVESCLIPKRLHGRIIASVKAQLRASILR